MHKRESMIRGYARRMAEIARLAAEMADIERKFGLEFAADIKDEVVQGRTRMMVERAAAAMAPAPSATAEDVSEPVDNTALYGALGAPRRRGV